MTQPAKCFNNERRVAQPAIPVIPGTLRSHRFGNAGGRCGDNGPRILITVQLQTKGRPQYLFLSEDGKRAGLCPCPPACYRQLQTLIEAGYRGHRISHAIGKGEEYWAIEDELA